MFPQKVPLSISQVLAWADDHRRRAGRWPHGKSGPVQANPAETWDGINQALTVGGRGLPGGDSFSRLLARERGRKEPRGRRPTQGGERIRLLHGPYRRPNARVGSRAACLVKGEVTITGRTRARLPWPRCLPVDRRGHPSLLVDEELARAIRCESAAAPMYWWGVSVGVVARWRKALGIGRAGTEGSRRLIQAAAQAGAKAVAEKEWTAEERELKRHLAIENNYVERLSPGCNVVPWWTAEELALLDTMPDEDLAKRIGKTRDAVRAKRGRQKIPEVSGRKAGRPKRK
jgi:hypothetical protein